MTITHDVGKSKLLRFPLGATDFAGKCVRRVYGENHAVAEAVQAISPAGTPAASGRLRHRDRHAT